MPVMNRLAVASIALATISLAACTDTPATAPVSSEPSMATAVPGIITTRATATVTLRVIDYVTKLPIAGSTMAFNTGFDGPKVNVVDNSASDADKRDGYFKVTLSKGSVYEARPVAILSKYDVTEAMQQIGSYANQVDLGTMTLRHNPKFTIEVRTPSSTSSSFNLVGFATFSVGWAQDTAPWMLRTDNIDDMDPAVGKITFYGRSAHTHRFCMTAAPAGYLLPSQTCISAWASWEQSATKVFVVYPKLF